MLKFVEQFIDHLSSPELPLNEFDQSILLELKSRFIHFESDKTSPEEEKEIVQYLQDVFKQRRIVTADTPDDYLVTCKGPNQYWIELAKQLAIFLDVSSLKILIPEIKNQRDPNSLDSTKEIKSLEDFYLLENDVISNLKSLLEKWQNMLPPFSTYDEHKKKFIARNLTLKELCRIRSKSDGTVFSLKGGATYSSYWDYIEQIILPKCNIEEECPRPILYELQNILKDLFEGRQADFIKRIKEWLQSLHKNYSTPEIGFLYSQSVKHDGKTVYLINILLDWYQWDAKEFSSEKLIQYGLIVAQWLCSYDSSMVIKSQHHALMALYEQLEVGKFFSVNHFLQYLNQLAQDNPDIKALFSQISAEKNVTPSHVDLLRQIYEHKELNCIMSRGEDNKPWRKLAEILAGADLIDRNYYCFLMPSLDPIEPVSLQPITQFNLGDFTFTDDGKLVCLVSVLDNYNRTGLFYNLAAFPPEPFTKSELSRIESAARAKYAFGAMLPHGRKERKELPIDFETVVVLKQLVDESFLPIGLTQSGHYDKTQITRAEIAYMAFLSYYNNLDEDKRKRLDQQRVHYESTDTNFSQLIEAVCDGKCIAVVGLAILKLVLDYFRDTKFVPAIVSERIHLNLDKLRNRSINKLVQDHSDISEMEEWARWVLNESRFKDKAPHKHSNLWFTSEQLMSGLLSLYHRREVPEPVQKCKPYIQDLIDLMIITHRKDLIPHLKELHINIEFQRMLTKDATSKEMILACFKETLKEKRKTTFIHDCQSWLIHRLSQLDSTHNEPKCGQTFFSPNPDTAPKAQASAFVLENFRQSNSKFGSVSDLIERLTAILKNERLIITKEFSSFWEKISGNWLKEPPERREQLDELAMVMKVK